MKPTAKAHIAVLCTNLFFASNYSMVKYISPSLVKPFALNLLRVGVSLILFWLFWFWGKTFSSEKAPLSSSVPQISDMYDSTFDELFSLSFHFVAIGRF